MKFGPVPVADAQGAILAHSEIAADPSAPQSLTYKIPKGTKLTADHVRDLGAVGLREVVVARLGPADVHEDGAASRLAEALGEKGAGLEIGSAARGRVNIRAACAGVVELNAARINAVNRIDPGITIATVPEWQRMAARGLIATIKIIPYSVDEHALAAACEHARASLTLRRPEIASATLIETQIGENTPGEKGRGAIHDRLARFGVMLSERVIVPHRRDAIAAALRSAPGEMLLILTGSATSDTNDTAPEAVRAAGGTVRHYGMPVDPGNLLFIGALSGKCVIGLPGCARSPALNGADWVLERAICGVDVSPDDIMGMGVGGLLKEIPSRPQPRERQRS